MIEILELESADLAVFKRDMREAFSQGFDEEILPESDIDKSLASKGAFAYKAVQNGEILGGAIVVINGVLGELDFLYVKVDAQNKGVGQKIWEFIERTHDEVELWHTMTPYEMHRNLHFYINVLGFKASEFFCPKHPNPYFPASPDDLMFGFEKRIKRQ